MLRIVFLTLVLFSVAIAPDAQANWLNNLCNYFYTPAVKDPFSKAMPNEMVTAGSLNDRAKAFAELYPENIKMVEDVKLEVAATGMNYEGKRNVLVISIPPNDQNFSKEFIKYFSNNLISFTGGGHLYSRIGSKVLDHTFTGINERDFNISNNDHFETMFSLSDNEFLNLKRYAEYSTENYKATVGKFEYDGPMQVEGQLNKNCGLDKGHNCTSWITTAPIGDGGENLKQLLGLGAYDIHRNPGWWQTYLATRASEERVPFVVYFTSAPLATALEKIKSNEVAPLGYNLH